MLENNVQYIRENLGLVTNQTYILMKHAPFNMQVTNITVTNSGAAGSDTCTIELKIAGVAMTWTTAADGTLEILDDDTQLDTALSTTLNQITGDPVTGDEITIVITNKANAPDLLVEIYLEAIN